MHAVYDPMTYESIIIHEFIISDRHLDVILYDYEL